MASQQNKDQDNTRNADELHSKNKPSQHKRMALRSKSNIPRPSRNIYKTVADTEYRDRMQLNSPNTLLTSNSKDKLYTENRFLKNCSEKVQLPQKEDYDVSVRNYLDCNRGFLESYIINSVSISQLEKWLIKKKDRYKKNESCYGKRRIENLCHKNMFMELLKKLKEETNEHSIIRELTHLICMSIGVDAYRVYKLYPDHLSFVQYFATGPDQVISTKLVQVDLENVKHVLHVAESGSCLRMAREDNKTAFPRISNTLLEAFGVKNVEEANHVLYQPILRANGKTGYVIEMWRDTEEFKDRDEDISSNYIVWGSLILQYCNLYLDKKRERNMADFLLDVVKAIFEEMVSLEQLVKKILEFAQKLVNADRASLFLVDHRNCELVSTVFDLKFEPGQECDMEKKEIRMPIDRGIAGHVALSGETMNIPDAYSDYRFNRDVDEVTGYTTNSILCMPVKVQGKVIGVVQMVNKINTENFDHEDEGAFEIFSYFFGLALHHARLYDKIMRKEQRYRVALEVLSYHNTCKEDDVQKIKNNQDDEEDVNSLTDFYFDPYKLHDIQKCKAVITMFDDLFELSKFDSMTITRFILTVKKNYRAVPYHNFDHGWSVAHAMYVIIKKDHKKRLDYKMRLALFVACLCHDLDHRGYTNKYLNEIASPLAAMYTTSPLEHHHFNITVTILQQDGHNIFSHLTSQEYKDILGYIRNCILATDLAAFFPNLAKLQEIHNMNSQRSKFNWAIPSHRDLGMAISMTAADLSASAKPWDIQIKTVKVIFKEFYEQGDKEREAGKTPIPMMDRKKPEEQPASQVGFLSQICIPCYTILYKILPKTKPMYLMAFNNLNNWKSKVTRNLDNSGGDELSCEDTLEFISDSELDEDTDIEKLESHLENLQDNAVGVSKKSEEIQDEDDEKKFEEINSKMTAGWKCIKSDSVSWEEDQKLKVNAGATKIKIWKDVDGNLVDEEGVVTRSNRALKVDIVTYKVNK